MNKNFRFNLMRVAALSFWSPSRFACKFYDLIANKLNRNYIKKSIRNNIDKCFRISFRMICINCSKSSRQLARMWSNKNCFSWMTKLPPFIWRIGRTYLIWTIPYPHPEAPYTNLGVKTITHFWTRCLCFPRGNKMIGWIHNNGHKTQ